MMRDLMTAAALALSLAPAGAETISQCSDRLQHTLTVMQSKPLLKEEHATALMWLRLDAEQAIAAGDMATCRSKVGTVEHLLAIEPEAR